MQRDRAATSPVYVHPVGMAQIDRKMCRLHETGYMIEVDEGWRSRTTSRGYAWNRDTDMPAQDDSREDRLIDRFNLERPPGASRSGTDAILEFRGEVIEFELKSITFVGDLGTARDIGPAHIEKWRNKHWIVGQFVGKDIVECRYASPTIMKPWIDDIWRYIEPDFKLATLIPHSVTTDHMISILGDKPYYTQEEVKSFMKNELSKAKIKMDHMVGATCVGYSKTTMLYLFRKRIEYVIKRGATYNNKKIRQDFIQTWPLINRDHAAELRRLIGAWMDRRST